MRLSFLWGLVAYLFLAASASPCLGGGILHVYPPSFQEQTFPVARPAVLLSRTLVTVSESRIGYRMDQTFLNDNEFPLNGLFIFPLPKEATDIHPEVIIDGISSPATVLSWDSFFPLLRELTVSMQDPALLGLAGKNVLIVQPVSIGIQGQKTFRIQYSSSPLIRDDHLVFSVPLDGERYSVGPVATLEIAVRFKMSRNVRTLFSPTHHLSLLRETPHRCLVTTKVTGKRVRDDFYLMTTFSGKDLNFRIFSHSSPGKSGYFMAFIEPPPLGSLREEQQEQDVALLLDCSGSMGQKEFELAKAAVVSALEKLGPGDRFNVIAVGTHPESLAKGLLAATPQNVASALRFVNSQRNESGTDLYNGLLDALDSFASHTRPSLILLVSDGRSSVGITKPETIVEEVGRRNKTRTRIFSLAIGERADVAMLDKLAVSAKGASVHVAGAEEFDAALGRLFAAVSPPNVSDASIDSVPVTLKDLVPSPIPDLVGTESVVIFGRYEHEGDRESKVRLRAKIEGRQTSLSKSIVFSESAPEHAYLPGMWAMRRMAQLLGQARVKGRTPEGTRQIEHLAGQFGFAIPAALTPTDTSPRSPDSSGDSGRLLWNFKRSFILSEVMSDACRSIDGKAFCFDNSRWIDSDYRTTMATRTIRFLSNEYFSLLNKTPDLGKYLALGPDVTIVHEKQAIRVTNGQ